jgi:hypothetical protein
MQWHSATKLSILELAKDHADETPKLKRKATELKRSLKASSSTSTVSMLIVLCYDLIQEMSPLVLV